MSIRKLPSQYGTASASVRYRKMKEQIRAHGGVSKHFDRAQNQLRTWLHAGTTLGLFVHFPIGQMAIVGTIMEEHENTFVFVSRSKEMSVVLSPWVYRKIKFWKSDGRVTLKMVRSFVTTEFADNITLMELGSSDPACLLKEMPDLSELHG